MIEYLLMAAGGALAGFIASLLGIGGGLFLVPLLNLVFGIPLHQCIAASLIAIIATSSAASANFFKEGLTDLKLGLNLSLATAAGAICGGFLAGYLNPSVLSLLFSGVLVYAAANMLRKKAQAEAGPESHKEYSIGNYPFGWSASFLAGNISGLLGVGGGIVKVPVMYLVMGAPLKVASATSSFMIGITGCASAFLYYFRGEIDFAVTGSVVLGIFFGSYLGSSLIFRVKTSFLKPLFVVILLFMALKMFAKGLGWRFL